MKARQLIGNAAFGPDKLRVLFKAFDEAWDSIAATVGNDPLAIEAARLRLANTILVLAQKSNTDAEQIKDTALDILALIMEVRKA